MRRLNDVLVSLEEKRGVSESSELGNLKAVRGSHWHIQIAFSLMADQGIKWTPPKTKTQKLQQPRYQRWSAGLESSG